MRADSDIDLLVVVDPLPNGRLARIEEFAPVETAVAPLLEQVRTVGVDTRISAVTHTPAEVRAGSPLMFVPRLVAISGWLRKEREFAFYGDIDVIPTEQYSQQQAQRAFDDATFVVDVIQTLEAGDSP